MNGKGQKRNDREKTNVQELGKREKKMEIKQKRGEKIEENGK